MENNTNDKKNISSKEKNKNQNKGIEVDGDQYVPKASVSKQLGIKTSKIRAKERTSNLELSDKKILDDIQAFTAYIEGGSIEEISKQFDVNEETLKFRIKKFKAHGIRSVLDLRETNGQNQEKVITKLISQRIIELKIKDPKLSPRAISRKLEEQDGTKISHVTINEYLNEVQLSDYQPSSFADNSFPP